MSETVGAALKAAREKRRLTLAQVSESTRVRVHYLQALENDDISAMPSAAQARGFMRLYAEFLGLDVESLIPPPAALVPESPGDAQAAVPESAEDERGPGLPRFLAGLLARITSRLAEKSSAGTSPASAASATSEPQAPLDDKKKQSR